MKFEVVINNTPRIVDLEHEANHWRITLDGKLVDADAIEIAPNIFSVLLNGKSHEIRVTPTPSGELTLQTGRNEFTAEIIDPRAWRGRRHGALEAEGRQQILAPMPGKIIRVLVQAGEKVQAGQGLLVVEAMKMQNEIRSPKSGTVERLLVKEGQPVNAGEVLAWID
jgi:biotin carboxyl carrier protein